MTPDFFPAIAQKVAKAEARLPAPPDQLLPLCAVGFAETKG